MNRADYEIVVLSEDWFGLPFSCRHLLRPLLPSVRMVWVQTIGLRRPQMTFYDLRRAAKKMTHWASRAPISRGSAPENLEVLDPVQIPYNDIGLVRRLNGGLMVRALRARAPLPQSRQRVLFTTWPFVSNLVGRMQESLSVYYRVDDFSEYPGVNRGYIQRTEQDLIRKVDLVVATAEKLMPQGAESAKARYLPHGVDFQHFSHATPRPGRENPLSHIPHPRIGFFGLINSWVDLGMIDRLATRQTGWQFTLIGPSQVPAASLPRRANIHYIGHVPYEDLPSYAAEFDVALIPFKINLLTQSVNPLKLLEYFAVGLPVVSTPLPEIRRFSDHLSIGSTDEDFEAGIIHALGRDGAEGRAARQELARANSWERRAMDLQGWIEAALRDRASRSEDRHGRR